MAFMQPAVCRTRCTAHPSAAFEPRPPRCSPSAADAGRTAPVPGLLAAALLVTLVQPVHAQEIPSLPGCSASSSCVSTSALNAPSAFLAPWVYEPTPRQNALRELVEELESRGARIVKQDEETGQVVAEIRYGRGEEELDDAQFVFKDEGLVLFRSQSRNSTPDAPFCWIPGCINGPGTRQRMESLRDALGWGNLETDEDKVWQQLLLH